MSENKYVELVDKLVEKAEAMQALQMEMQDLAMAKDQESTLVEKLYKVEKINDEVEVKLSIDFESDNDQVIYLENDDYEGIALSIEDFNNINQFLGRYNEVIFRFHNHLETQKAEAEAE